MLLRAQVLRGVDKDTLSGRQNLAGCLASMGSPRRGLATLRDVDPDGDSGDWWKSKFSLEVSRLGRVRQRGDSQRQ